MLQELERSEQSWPKGKPLYIRDLERVYGPIFRPITALHWEIDLEMAFEKVNEHIKKFFGPYMVQRDINVYTLLTVQHQFVGYSLGNLTYDPEHLDDGVAGIKISIWNEQGGSHIIGTVISFNETCIEELFYHYGYSEYAYSRYINETLYHEALHVLIAVLHGSDKVQDRLHRRIEKCAKILARGQKVRPRAIVSFLEGRARQP